MQNFPRQWPGPADDPQGARYAEWSSQKAPIAQTPFVEAYESARLPPLSSRKQQNNVSEYSVNDFAAYPQYFYDRTKHLFKLDELGLRFSDPSNVFAIHRELSKAIHDEFNLWIAKQDDTQLSEVMIKAYLSFFNINHRTGDVEEDLYNLNVTVIKTCLSNMRSNLILQIKQLSMIDRVPVPNPLPINVNNKGLDGRSCQDLSRVTFLPLAELQPPPTSRYANIGNPSTRNWAEQVFDNIRQ